MTTIYTWVPVYAEIVKRLTGYRNRQPELIGILKQAGVEVFNDKDREDHVIELSEIDPFTFLCFINKYGDVRRKKILRKLCEIWQINLPVKDCCGIPSANAQKVWLFSWKYERVNDEINRLWNFFDKLLQDKLSDADFGDILKIANVGQTKLTEAIFYVRPLDYLCINSIVKPYLKEELHIDPEFSTFTEFKDLCGRVKAAVHDNFPEISYKAFLKSDFSGKPVNYYRIGTTTTDEEVKISMFPEMLSNNVVSIGWAQLGDLEEIEPLTKAGIGDALVNRNLFDYASKPAVATRKSGEIYSFYKEIKPNDIVLAVDGFAVKAIGRITSHNYFYEPALGFPHCRNVEWIRKDIRDLLIEEGKLTTVWKYENKDTIRKIESYLGVNQPSEITKPELPKNSAQPMNLNTIIYGPPGTGKTFSTVNQALEILGERTAGRPRHELKELFDAKMKEGQIVFTTFHQSMSYEDFIEGIKPLKPEEKESVKYDVVPGLFKTMAVEAALAYTSLKEDETDLVRILAYNELYDQMIADMNEQIARNQPVKLTTKTGGSIDVEEISDRENLWLRHQNGSRNYCVSRNRLSVLYEKFPEPEKIENIQDAFRNEIGGMNATAYWSVLQELKKREARSRRDSTRPPDFSQLSMEDKIRLVNKIDWKTHRDTPAPKNYILIIDEVNRGNVSQIFGELITLIEDDKRLGRMEELKVTLPYSKSIFGVPPNLYIIGTMNTADRSIEALDTALRRRFNFQFIPPDNSLVPEKAGSIELRKVFEKINERISFLLDADHQLGHYFFMNLTNENSIKNAFRNKILPLLKEYFYNDYGKIRMILGDGFVKKTDNYLPAFAVSDHSELNRELFTLLDINDNFNITEALRKTIAGE